MQKIIIFTAITAVLIMSSGDNAAGKGNLNWHDCVAKARKNHPGLASAREKINQNKANVGKARSPLLPEITASAGKTRSKTVISNGASYSNTKDTYSYGISGKQLIFDGFKSVYDVRKARKEVNVSIYRYRVVASDARLYLRTAFVQLLKEQKFLDIARKILKRRKKSLQLVKMRYQAGREHRGSLLTAQANLAQAEFDVIRARRNKKLAQHRLVKEMGLREFQPFLADGGLAVPDKNREKPDLGKLAKTNPLLLEMIRLKEAAEYGVKSARVDFFPRVYGFMNAGRTGQKWMPANAEWSMGVEMTLPLMEGAQRFYEVSRAKAEYRQLTADVRSVRDRVIFTLEQKWISLQNELDRVAVQQKFLKASVERSRIAAAQYSIGIKSFDNWIIIEDAMVKALMNYLDAQSRALIAEAEWIQAKGETLDYDI